MTIAKKNERPKGYGSRMARAALLAFAIVLAAEGGVPLPLPIDIVLLALGERAGAGEVPLWVVMGWLRVVVVAGTAALFLVARLTGNGSSSAYDRVVPRSGRASTGSARRLPGEGTSRSSWAAQPRGSERSP